MVMMSLFSVFDPCSYFGITLNWVIMMFLLMGFPLKYYYVSGGVVQVMNSFVSVVSSVFIEVGSMYYLGVVFVSTMTFIYLMLSNLLGLFPYVFTSTAHPMVTMGWGIVFWVSFFMMGFISNSLVSAAHLVPQGSPLFLAPVMVVIESISHLMRPFTLSIRLAANMMAGHLIVGLLASVSSISILGLGVSIMFQTLLLVLEVGVAIIQGFVFSILILLYCLEYY